MSVKGPEISNTEIKLITDQDCVKQIDTDMYLTVLQK